MLVSRFESYYHLNEATQIEIDQIENLKDDKLFVFVSGGIGAGKTFLAQKFIKLPIMENDALMKAFEGKESFVCKDINQNINGTIGKLQLAKQNGFTTILVFVDSDPEKAFTRLQKLPERESILKEKVILTHDDALQAFQTIIKDNRLVDFYVHAHN